MRRLRPIVLTAAAAVLAMIPLTRSTFADGGGDHGRADRRHAADLLFVPALYAAWYRVRREPAQQRGANYAKIQSFAAFNINIIGLC